MKALSYFDKNARCKLSLVNPPDLKFLRTSYHVELSFMSNTQRDFKILRNIVTVQQSTNFDSRFFEKINKFRKLITENLKFCSDKMNETDFCTLEAVWIIARNIGSDLVESADLKFQV